MQEVEFAREVLRFAHLTPGPSPDCFADCFVPRNATSACGEGRAHHLGRRLLIEIGMQPEQWRANVHQRVLDELYNQFVATRRMSLNAWVALDKLRSLRRKADYELATPVRLRNVNRAISLFTQFADECYQILGVS